MNKIFIFIAQTAVLFALPLTASADIYQWKDAEGKTQYSDQPPSDRPARLIKAGVSSQTVAENSDIKTDEKAAKKEPKSLAEKDQESRKRKIDAEKIEKEAAAKDSEKKASCTQARDQMKTLEEGGRIYKRDEKGEKNYLDDNALAKEMSSAKANVGKYCS
jgi:Domain of unknown function (DUF4124)